MQVASDAVTVLEHHQPLLVVAGAGHLQGERRLLGELLREADVDVEEAQLVVPTTRG